MVPLSKNCMGSMRSPLNEWRMKLNNSAQKFIQNISKTLSQDSKLWNCKMKTRQTLMLRYRQGLSTKDSSCTENHSKNWQPGLHKMESDYQWGKLTKWEKKKITSHSSNRRLTSKYKEIRNTKGTNKPINSWANELSFQKKYSQLQ